MILFHSTKCGITNVLFINLLLDFATRCRLIQIKLIQLKFYEGLVYSYIEGRQTILGFVTKNRVSSFASILIKTDFITNICLKATSKTD